MVGCTFSVTTMVRNLSSDQRGVVLKCNSPKSLLNCLLYRLESDGNSVFIICGFLFEVI